MIDSIAKTGPDVGREMGLVISGQKGYTGSAPATVTATAATPASNTGETAPKQPTYVSTGILPDNTNIRLEVGSEGENVKLLQRWLNELGYRDENGRQLTVDGVFGGHTLAAVNKFKDKELPGGNTDANRGVVGPTTWERIYKKASIKQRMEGREKTTEETTPTTQEVGEVSSGGQNPSGIDKMIATVIDETWYYGDGSKYNGHPGAWCVDFVQWCARQAGVEFASKTSGTDTMRKAYVEKGIFGDGKYTPMAGDLIFYQNEDKSDGHTGLVVANIRNADGKSGTIYSVEGNTYTTDSTKWGVYVVKTKYVIDSDGNYTYYRSLEKDGSPHPMDKPVTGFGKNGGTSYGTIPVQLPKQKR
jgi:peptidoglycan hydrolase-like protein with peptidoglycan-binding domain